MLSGAPRAEKLKRLRTESGVRNSPADPPDPPDPADSPETVAATVATLPNTRAGDQDDGS